MQIRTPAKLVLVALAVSAATTACAPKNTAYPPLIAPPVPRRSIHVDYTRLRVKIAAFKDRTTLLGGVTDLDTGPFYRSGNYLIAAPGSDATNAVAAAAGIGENRAPGVAMALSAIPAGGAALVQTIPDAIIGVLGQSGRFEVMAGGDECDVLLAGSITGAQQGTATLDLRLISCFTKSDMASVTTPIRYTAGNSEIAPNRDDIRSAVQKLVGTLPDPREIKKGQIIARDGNFVTINLGKEDKLMKGMKAFAVTYGDRVIDPKSGDMLGDETFTGDLYLFAVYNRISRAYIVPEPGTNVKVGDYVIFK